MIYMRPFGESELLDLINIFPSNTIMCEIG